jgi:redox-sensitive bicupin YhaK (pirin superfamily)
MRARGGGTVEALSEWRASRDISSGLLFLQRRRTAVPKPDKSMLRVSGINGPARVILGRYSNAASEVRAPEGANYLDVTPKKGEKWRYEPPSGHTVAWAAVHEGELAAPAIGVGELAVSEESNAAIEFRSDRAHWFHHRFSGQACLESRTGYLFSSYEQVCP